MKKTIISSVAALALIVGVGSASAQTMTAAEMQAMIAQLTAQLALLSGTTTTPTMSSYVHPGVTLRVGSKGVAVTALQNALNNLGFSAGKADGVYGKGTAAAVKAFQMSKGLGADGVAGNNTHGALVIALSGTTTTPTVPGTTGTLKGGAGSVQISPTSTDVESDVEEGSTEKVLGMEVEADGSDIAVTNLKVTLAIASTSGSSRIEKYLDEVTVWLGDKEVGSIDADEFSKDGTSYTKSISLSGAMISENDEENLYIGVKALASVDDENAMVNVILSIMHYIDVTVEIFID